MLVAISYLTHCRRTHIFRTQSTHGVYINRTADLANKGGTIELMWSQGDVGHMDNLNKSLDLGAMFLALAMLW